MDTLHVVTPVTRPANLPRLAASLEPLRTHFAVRWHVVYSDGSRPDWWGGWERNQALDAIKDGWVYCLDDDNLMHPGFGAALATAMRQHPEARVFVFSQENGLRANADPDLGKVDMGMIAFHHWAGWDHYLKELRFEPGYEADFNFFKRLAFHTRHIVAINEPVTYYNALRDAPPFDPHPLCDAWRTDHVSYCDLRHLRWMHAALMSGRFRRVLEVGCFDGWSATAFLDAARLGKVDEVHLCDPHPQPNLGALVERFNLGDRVRLHRRRGVELLAEDRRWDLVFLDGDHTKANVVEEARHLVPIRPRAVFAHDTAAHPRYPDCEGPPHLKAALQLAGYYVVEDALPRPNERTDRGLLFAAANLDDFAAGRHAYGQHCG